MALFFFSNLIKFYSMFGLRHGWILQLLNMVHDIIISVRALWWIFTKHGDCTEGRMSPALWRFASDLSDQLEGRGRPPRYKLHRLNCTQSGYVDKFHVGLYQVITPRMSYFKRILVCFSISVPQQQNLPVRNSVQETGKGTKKRTKKHEQ